MQVLQFEQQYLDALPSAQDVRRRAACVRDTVTHVVVQQQQQQQQQQLGACAAVDVAAAAQATCLTMCSWL